MSSGLRILFVTHAYPRFADDGAGSFLHRLAVSLRASGCELRVLAPSGKDLPATTDDEAEREREAKLSRDGSGF